MKNNVSELINLINNINEKAAMAIVNGNTVTVRAKFNNPLKSLYRWGNELILIWKNHRLVENNLVDLAWSWNQREAKKEAAIAASYFLDPYNNLEDCDVKFEIH